jgi:hypothetical protein
MGVLMVMMLGQMQPKTKRHQKTCDHELGR